MADIIKIKAEHDAEAYGIFQSTLSSISESQSKALFLFSTEWCPDCPPVEKALEELAQHYNGDVNLYSVDVGSVQDWKRTVCEGDHCTPERDNAFMRDAPYLQVIPAVALYVGLPRLVLLANKTIMPNRPSYLDHIKTINDVLILADRF